MAKTLPVRLDKALINAATQASKHSNRTTAEQIEHWALLGLSVAKTINRDDMLDVLCGLAQLKVEEVMTPLIDPDAVFDQLEFRAPSNKPITGSSVRYQASRTNPGQLERIDLDGHITLGQFKNGVFTPKTKRE